MYEPDGRRNWKWDLKGERTGWETDCRDMPGQALLPTPQWHLTFQGLASVGREGGGSEEFWEIQGKLTGKKEKEKKKKEMEVKMNKEIRNYQESMFMGLNLRQCIFSLLAIAVAVGIYFGLGDYVGQEMTGWLCILGAAPFAVCGFFQYHGMNAEQFAWAYIKSEFLYPKRLLFQSEDLYHACMEETMSLGEKTGEMALSF